MGFLSVGRPDPINGQNSSIGKAAEVKQENLGSIFGGAQTGAKQDPYKEFNDNVKTSILGNKFLDPKTLLAKGYEESEFMDMNGGVHYINEKTKSSVRVLNHRIFGDGKAMSYKNKNMAHFVTYDDNGKATGGIVQVKQSDGSIKVYNYEVDINGNKFIKSVKTSDHDYFADYE